MELLQVELDLLMNIEFGNLLTEEGNKCLRKIMQKIYDGDSQSMVDLASLYQFGVEEWGLPEDYDKCAYWNLMGARQGNINGIYRYGRNFLNIKSDDGRFADIQKKAMEYMHYAADKGQVDAQRTMGIVYTYGFGGYPVCYEKAYEYLNKAIENGDEEAKENLEKLKLYE